jgi:hypothetical protein
MRRKHGIIGWTLKLFVVSTQSRRPFVSNIWHFFGIFVRDFPIEIRGRLAIMGKVIVSLFTP